MPFTWVLHCPSCGKSCTAQRNEFNKNIECPHCKHVDRIDLGFEIKGEEQFKSFASSVDLIRSLKKKFSTMSDEELLLYRDRIDLRKQGPKAMVTLTHILRELEKRNIP